MNHTSVNVGKEGKGSAREAYSATIDASSNGGGGGGDGGGVGGGDDWSCLS